ASADAFALLRDVIIRHNTVRDAVPQRNILDDQIVWGRSPARLDFAGGWTDTPPYCLEHGGRVVNLAVNLNGQPPIQVFGRVCETPHLRIRSIDVGVEEVIATHDALRAGERLGSGFSIARAALRLAGFDPAFNPALHGGLAGFLKKTFGGGIELSLLAAIPKGSGLGTSSILAATLLGTLSEMCGLHWGPHDIFQRTIVLEQMLGSGGGWQDQVGGVTGGLKLVASRAGLAQQLDLRWLPPHMVERAIGDGRLLLYYTGMTRVAQNILGEIVRGLFLNDARRIRVINDIGRNAAFAADAVQRQSWDDFCEAIRRSWRLNQGLDEGTNPPAVQAILDRVRGPLSAAKLLGAGGGGYLMLLATTREDGLRVREILSADPPNPRARFVELSVSHEGFQVTRS
ncbi:MAG: bifunctional fucokinase/L-fucose-1-P-guanylyltransferase, partial [Kiritimatiellaeota bacterium]|nr:bifunctional fucokinase/L-fucose-1-P-guanylyltransferase [Kiritimatiellota bacterium]